VLGETPDLGIQIDDSSSIPLIAELPMASGFQLRARLRAAAGDIILSNCEPPAGYEAYNADHLDLGHATWLRPSADQDRMTVAKDCLANVTCLDILARALSQKGGYLHPYLSTEEIWQLAAELTGRSGSGVLVLGPPPALAALVNNKCSFLQIARLVAGEQATIPFAIACTVADVSGFIEKFKHRMDRIVIRLPDSTAGLGVKIVDTGALPSGPKLIAELDVILATLGWEKSGDLLLSEWTPSLASVSTQMWLPPLQAGGPVCEGIYRQRLHPRNGMQYWGASPAYLPDPTAAELRRLSCLLCSAFQRAGYVGRCSFDFLLTGERLKSATPIFVECNGRWGGVSAVMSLVDRVSRPGARPAHSFGPVSGDSLRGAELRDILAVLAGELYDSRRKSGRGVMAYHVGGLNAGRMDICTMAEDQESAQSLWELCAQKLECTA